MRLLRGEQHAMQLSECGPGEVHCRPFPLNSADILILYRADRANQQIIDQLSSHKDEMKALKEDWGGRFDKLEQMIIDMGGGRSLNLERPDTKPPLLKLESPPGPATGQLPAGVDSLSLEPTAKDVAIVDTSPSASLTESTGSDPVAARTNEIYIAHNTAAQKLFRWRSIKQLLRQSSKLDKLDLPDRAEGYVMDLEINKGVMRIYGKGRQLREVGIGSPASAAAASPTPSSVSVAGDETSTASSPTSSTTDTLWGTGFAPNGAEFRPTSDVGGLGPDNTLKLETRTVSRLLQSYLDNIHILHPFLDQRELTRIVDHFKRRHNPHETNSSKVGFAVPVNANLDAVRDSHAILNRAQKRKHSDGQFHGVLGESSQAPTPMGPKVLLEKSPETALTLLVMALGKICECRAPLPGPVSEGMKDNPNHTSQSFSPSRGQTDSPPPPFSQPMRHSPSGSSQSTASASAPSPMSAGRLAGSSPRSSVGEPSSGVRNVDVIPGLAYYAQATDILGNLTGLHDLTYAQCCLLAGLYAGQLANTLESLTWIQIASRICRFLVSE